MKVDNILQTIGNTPHVRINRLFGPAANVWVKSERSNPGGKPIALGAQLIVVAAGLRRLLQPFVLIYDFGIADFKSINEVIDGACPVPVLIGLASHRKPDIADLVHCQCHRALHIVAVVVLVKACRSPGIPARRCQQITPG